MKFQCTSCGTPLGFEGLCWKCRAEQERGEILAWSEEEVAQRLSELLQHPERLESHTYQERKTFEALACYHGIFPPEVARAAAKAEVYYPHYIYYHAPEDVRDMLLEKLRETKDSSLANHLQCCLAMQGDATVLAAFAEMEKNPLPWRKQLYVAPSYYALCGGWTFDAQGKRTTLNFDTCLALEKASEAQGSLFVGRVREEHCPHCGCNLADMLVLDGRDERLAFLGMDGIITATCCPNCVTFSEAAFSRFALDGGSTPMPSAEAEENSENYLDEAAMQSLSAAAYTLSKQAVPLFYGTHSDDVHTIGGFANWVQDFVYLNCPVCGKKMHYLAQLQWDMLMDGMEGTLFIEFCPVCHVAGMLHQQT